MGFPIPNQASLPGASRPGGGGTPVPPGPDPLAQINNVYSMEFSGTDEYVRTSSITIGDTFTFSCWVNANVFTTNMTFLSSPNYFTAGKDGNFVIRFNSTTSIQFVTYDSTSSLEVVTGTIPALTNNTWNHFAITSTPTTSQIYWNAVPVTTTGVNTKGLDDLLNGLIIGDNITNNNPGFPGKIDEVAIFNTALTAPKVLSIYNATEIVGGVNKTADLSQLTTPPIKWYRMGD